MYGLISLAIALPFSMMASTTSLNTAAVTTDSVECMVRCVDVNSTLHMEPMSSSCGCNEHIVLTSDNQTSSDSASTGTEPSVINAESNATTAGHPGDGGTATTGHPGDAGSAPTGQPGDSGSSASDSNSPTTQPGDHGNSTSGDSSRTSDSTTATGHDSSGDKGTVLADATTQSLPNAGPGSVVVLAGLAAIIGTVASRLFILHRIRSRNN